MNDKRVCMSFKRIFTCAFSCLALLTGAVALRDVRLSVPAAIVRGQTAVLQCHYNLEGAALYSLKWYKGRREFFRFTPRESPPIKVFPISGVVVDRSRSNATHLTLLRAGAALSGRYSCEVSADAPSFHTNLVSAELAVVDVPSDSPSITGVKPRYRTGDTLMANCSSSWSRPAATLLWVVNELQAPVSQLEHYPVVRDPTTGRERSSLGLNLPLLTPGRFKVRCVASIEPVYFKSAETSVEATEKPPPSLQLAPPPPPPTRLSWGLLDDVVEEYKHKETSVASGSLEPTARQYVLSLTILVSAATVLGS